MLELRIVSVERGKIGKENGSLVLCHCDVRRLDLEMNFVSLVRTDGFLAKVSHVISTFVRLCASTPLRLQCTVACIQGTQHSHSERLKKEESFHLNLSESI